MSRKGWGIAWACAALFAATWGAAEDKVPAAPAGADDDDIREAVFRYQISKNETEVYFLQIDGADPSTEFMKRFEGHDPPVKPKSACVAEGAAQDKETKKHGAILSVGKVTRAADGATVQGSVYWAPLAAVGGTYTLVRKDGKWVVTGFKMEWIS